MFSRNFMKKFPVIKYADITAKAGTMSTDAWLVSKPEVQLKRGLVYMGVSIVVLFMFENWHTGDEIFGPATRPYSTPTYERNVPKEVLYPNQEIIEGFEAIHKMNNLKQTFSYYK